MKTIKRTFGLIAVACLIIVAGLFAGCQKSKGTEPTSGPADLVVSSSTDAPC